MMNWLTAIICQEQNEYLLREIKKYENQVTTYRKAYKDSLETIRKLRSKRKPRKKNLSSSKGFKKVTDEEAQEMYDMWKEGHDMTHIASTLNRSNSCVSIHIHKLYEKEYGNGESMERVSGQEDRTSQKEE